MRKTLIITHFAAACLRERAGRFRCALQRIGWRKAFYRRDAEGAEKGKQFNTEDTEEKRRTQGKRRSIQYANQEIGIPRRLVERVA